ncbi:hypothetical protein J7E79_04490 [Bacillus sp. ISL-40]|uniref:hypothetical protein n=1 Tax=unclassified Bacillus (in: firmicutes) TaxID=185979 RepID=UPI001BEC7BAC|nr:MULTISPECIES: hypothetical protein [unclassified Bacillus (in: firmicutes)]MBT2696675.1 hypothetical protein [Bacillus sp. ISL-40]MBT2739925.1 hypothetical protein [Bacillus sp. ISL-77]
MADVYKIGPILISFKLMIIFLSGIFGYLTLLMAMKRSEINRKVIMDLFSSCILILIFTWKFGGVLLNPKLLLSNPLLVLFMTGSNSTLLLGLIISIAYLAFKIYKKAIPLKLFLDLLSLSVLPSMFIYNLFIPVYGYPTRFPWGISLGSENVDYHPIHIYFAITCAMIILFLYKTIKTKGSGNLFMKTAVLIGLSGLVFTFLSPQMNFIMGVSQKQWLFIFVIFVGLLTSIHKENEEVESKD